MSRYLISTTEVYRVDSEAEAQALIKESKESSFGDLVKYNNVYKERKQKKEVVDAWYRVSLTRSFDDEKEPVGEVKVSYSKESAF